MIGAIDHQAGRQTLRHWANLFEITNSAALTLPYRLLRVHGLPADEYYDKNINQLVKAIRFEIRQPATLVRRDDAHYVAIPAQAPLPTLERKLMPHIATLAPAGDAVLELDRLDAGTAPIARDFLRSALRAPLWRDDALWESGRASYGKESINGDDAHASVDIYPGFVWNVVVTGSGRLFVVVDLASRYVERRWLTEGAPHDFTLYRGRHCLYHYGHQWYVVQLAGLAPDSIAEQRFVPDGDGRITDVLTYTRDRWGTDAPPWVRDLDPDSPAIIYRYPTSERQRYGALALCKRILSTADAEAAGLHRRTIIDPAPRFARIADIVRRHFQRAELVGRPIAVSTEPLDIERRVYPVPRQRFGHDRVLAVDQRGPGVTDTTLLERLGQRRQQMLLDPQAGPLDTSPFDAQYVVLPQGLPRSINEDIVARFIDAMRTVSGQGTYQARQILYDDRTARTLYQQVQAIKRAVESNGIGRGYALLVLPEHAKPLLHNYVKRALWPHVQVQCAMARKIRSHYHQDGVAGWRPAPGGVGKLASYVRNCALGMMVVNRKWAWALATPLHYDVYIGIDVLNGMAGLTFVYNNGRQIFFRDYPGKQKERLTTPQLRDILVKHLGEDLLDLGLHPRSIVIHRDGRTFASESTGIHLAMRELTRRGILPPDVVVGVVDIRKVTTEHIRLVEGVSVATARNPTIGSPWVLGPRDGIVCTTGYPFRFPGTSNPLAAVIVEGDLSIDWVLDDIFALAQPIFTAPDKCARLPVTIKLSDDLLEPIAAAIDDEATLYETEQDLLDEEDDTDDLPTEVGTPAALQRAGRGEGTGP